MTPNWCRPNVGTVGITRIVTAVAALVACSPGASPQNSVSADAESLGSECGEPTNAMDASADVGAMRAVDESTSSQDSAGKDLLAVDVEVEATTTGDDSACHKLFSFGLDKWTPCEIGLCKRDGPECIAASDEDCGKTDNCKTWSNCCAIAGRCAPCDKPTKWSMAEFTAQLGNGRTGAIELNGLRLAVAVGPESCLAAITCNGGKGIPIGACGFDPINMSCEVTAAKVEDCFFGAPEKTQIINGVCSLKAYPWPGNPDWVHRFNQWNPQSEQACLSHDNCKDHGNCHLIGYKDLASDCVPTSDADCAQSTDCKKYGWCTFGPKTRRCWPKLD